MNVSFWSFLGINKKIIRWIYFGILVEHGQHVHLYQPHCKDQHNTHSQASDNRCCLTVWSFLVRIPYLIAIEPGLGNTLSTFNKSIDANANRLWILQRQKEILDPVLKIQLASRSFCKT
ncbi:MAG: hypothetical protein Ct9H300mP23_10700 [Nitrospinota bacterium]|nr:MAG: hypothetical protein Ct9H300mP23_10700 [Nitrospinota bacterium]